jgi:hypothetical protein
VSFSRLSLLHRDGWLKQSIALDPVNIAAELASRRHASLKTEKDATKTFTFVAEISWCVCEKNLKFKKSLASS